MAFRMKEKLSSDDVTTVKTFFSDQFDWSSDLVLVLVLVFFILIYYF